MNKSLSIIQRISAVLVLGVSSVTVWADYPVSINHKFGTMTLTDAPTRVVSVGYSDQDDLLALGVKPVAIRDWYGDMPFATWPWAQDELGSATPVVLSRDALDFEAIAALQPDLIVGISSGMSADDYAKLSKIAPTLAQSADYIEYGMPWQERTLWVGQALDQTESATALVARIEQRIAQEKSAHPEFQNKQAAVAFYYSGQPGVYSSSDLRSRLLTQLGFRIPSVYDELAGASFYASFSEERLDLLNVDVLLWLSASDALNAADAIPMRQFMPFYQQGREVFVGDTLGGAFSFLSPLSIEFLLDNLIPELELAVDGDPTTVVPSSLPDRQ